MQLHAATATQQRMTEKGASTSLRLEPTPCRQLRATFACHTHPHTMPSQCLVRAPSSVAGCRYRGYGRSAAKALEAIRDGEDPTATGTMFQPGGSLGNGGAMRIAPLGLAYRWNSRRSHAVMHD
jgi:ADP-ribosylglycohydrolase